MATSRKRHQRRRFGRVRPSGRKHFQAGYTHDGAVHYAPQTFDTVTRADGWLDGEERLILDGRWTPPATRAVVPVSVAEHVAVCIAARDVAPRTRAHYEQLLANRIAPCDVGGMPLHMVTPAVVREWHAEQLADADGEERHTARAHAYALLKMAMAMAVEDRLVQVNPCRIRGASRPPKPVPVRPATTAELAIITASLPPRMALIVPLQAWCALRYGEVTELRRRDIEIGTERGTVHVTRAWALARGCEVVGPPKAESIRDVAIPPHILPLVEAHLDSYVGGGPEALLFHAEDAAGHLRFWTFGRHFRKARSLAGRPDLRGHTLRHTGATLAAQAGATTKELMARLGHSTPAMAMVYQHAAEERDRMVAERMSALALGADS